jgi:hypothetical protein
MILTYNWLQGFVPSPLLSPAHWCKGRWFLSLTYSFGSR